MNASFVKGVFGGYVPTPVALGEALSFDSVIGLSFGTVTHHDSVNASLRYFAEVAGVSGDGCPVMMDYVLAECASYSGNVLDLIVDGQIADIIGRGLGTWGVLVNVVPMMKRFGLNRPLLVAHAVQVNRVAIQARKLGLDPVIAPGLPDRFDRDSSQIWTRSLALWVPHELIGAPVLKAQGKL